jgi:hypothetical protein
MILVNNQTMRTASKCYENYSNVKSKRLPREAFLFILCLNYCLAARLVRGLLAGLEVATVSAPASCFIWSMMANN